MEIIRAHHLDNLVDLRRLGVGEFARWLPTKLYEEEGKSPGYAKDLWGDDQNKGKFIAGAVGMLSGVLELPGEEPSMICGCED